MTPNTTEYKLYPIASWRPFAQSTLWELQQDYFTAMGVDAWRLGEVPHYVTSNPRMAQTYAELVLALWRDCYRLNPEAQTEPFYICELGAGSGRFAFHFLKRLTRLCQQAAILPTTFCYIVTDVAEQNLAYLDEHPCLQPFFDKELLDLALFDVNQSNQFYLQRCQHVIARDSLNHPLVVIANYLFDSIPQELFYIDEQQISQCLVALSTYTDPADVDWAELLGHVHCDYDYQLLTELPYAEEPYLQQILGEYQQTLTDTHLLFPVSGLRCLHRLQALSRSGLLLLSADKGHHCLSNLEGGSSPSLATHTGCFSLSVNYHALKRFCEQGEGVALFPSQQHNHINIGCLLLLKEAEQYQQTIGAYAHHVVEFGPDAFYSIAKHARQDISTMCVRDILAYGQLSLYDAHLFACYVPRLLELIPELQPHEWEGVRTAIDSVWDLYFPIGEERDLADSLACLLFEMGDYRGALTYLTYSIELYGEHNDVRYQMARCYQALNQDEQATQFLQQVLIVDPTNELAIQLLEQDEAVSISDY